MDPGDDHDDVQQGCPRRAGPRPAPPAVVKSGVLEPRAERDGGHEREEKSGNEKAEENAVGLRV